MHDSKNRLAELRTLISQWAAAGPVEPEAPTIAAVLYFLGVLIEEGDTSLALETLKEWTPEILKHYEDGDAHRASIGVRVLAELQHSRHCFAVEAAAYGGGFRDVANRTHEVESRIALVREIDVLIEEFTKAELSIQPQETSCPIAELEALTGRTFERPAGENSRPAALSLNCSFP